MRAPPLRRIVRQPRRGKRLLFEQLDERTLLAVVANDDPGYTTAEDMPLDVAGGAAEVLIPRGSTWSYLDEMTNGRGTPATPTETYPTDDAAEADATPGVADAWNSPDFNTASSDPAIGMWGSGSAVFGSGVLDGNPATDPDIPLATTLMGNATTTYTVTTYLFVKKFTVPAATLAGNPSYSVELLADDGGVLYLNGTEIGRYRMALGAVTSTQNTDPPGTTGPEGYAVVALSKTPSEITALLLAEPAENTIAFELHQAGPTSSDSGFDLSFSATGPGGVLTNDMIDNPTGVASITVTTQPASGNVTIRPNGSFRYTSPANFNGLVSFVYTVSNGVDMDTAIVSIDVTPVDDAPVAATDTYATFANTPLVVSATTPPANEVIFPQGSTWSYLDQMNDTETYPLDDAAEADSTPGVADAWNSAAFNTTSSDPAIGGWESGGGMFAAGGITCCTTTTMLDGTNTDTTTYLFRTTVNLSPAQAAAISTRGLVIRFVADDGIVVYLDGTEVQRVNMPMGTITNTTFAPGSGNEGAGGANNLPSSFRLQRLPATAGPHVVAVELHRRSSAPPNAADGDAGFDAQVEIPGFAGVLFNDTDVENDPITAITLVPGQGVQNGTLNVNQDGTFTYSPNSGFSGPDTFQYTITANGATSAPATVTINVVPSTSTCTASPDLNASGGVNRADLAILSANYGLRTGATAAQGDLNCDGAVGVRDLVILRNAFSPIAVPSAPSAVFTRAAAVDRVFSESRPRTGSPARASLIAAPRSAAATLTGSTGRSESTARPLRTNRAARARVAGAGSARPRFVENSTFE